MSRKTKLKSLHFFFNIFSTLADKSGGWQVFVKPKLLFGSLIISISTYGQSGTVKKDSTENKQRIIIDKDSTLTEEIEENVFCYISEQMPTFPGGEITLFDFLAKNINYPKSALKSKTEGRVILQFIISENGTIEKIHVVKSLTPDCDSEAIRVINKMPKWIPGKQNGKFVSVKYTLPIYFKLK